MQHASLVFDEREVLTAAGGLDRRLDQSRSQNSDRTKACRRRRGRRRARRPLDFELFRTCSTSRTMRNWASIARSHPWMLSRGSRLQRIITPDISQAEILPTGGEKQIFDFLKQTIQSWRDDPQRYVDVVVSKKKNIMLDLPLKVAFGHAHGLPPA
jgi:hypothetical protein